MSDVLLKFELSPDNEDTYAHTRIIVNGRYVGYKESCYSL